MSEVNICFSCDLPWKRQLDRFLADLKEDNRSAYIRQALDFYRLTLKLNAGQKEPLMSSFEPLNSAPPLIFIESQGIFK
jgi:hypothetical protein